MDNQISAVMTATMSKIKEMVDTNTVVGEPITTPDDITLIPLSRVSFAFASGGSEFPMKENKNGVGCGSGAGVKVEPMGFLIVKDGNVRMLNVMPPASNTFDRLVDMTPQVFDRDLLAAALQNAKTQGIAVTDDCSAVEALGMPVQLTDGDEENLKITTPLDLELAALILRRRANA